MQRAKIEKFRADIPALAQYVWFQNGGVSVTPAPSPPNMPA